MSGVIRDELSESQMSIKALKSRLAASGSLFVFLITATRLLQHAGAATSSMGICFAETDACFNETVCSECGSRGISVDEFNECLNSNESGYSNEGDEDYCALYSATPCCIDALSTHDCLGNNAFVVLYTCLSSFISVQAGGEGCSTITCSAGIGGDDEVEGDDNVTVTDDAVGADDGVTGTDDAVGDDDPTGTDRATGTDDDATGTDRAVETDDASGVEDDDATWTDDAVGTDDPEGGTAEGVGETSGVWSSSPSPMLTLFLGVAFLTGSPFLDVLL